MPLNVRIIFIDKLTFVFFLVGFAVVVVVLLECKEVVVVEVVVVEVVSVGRVVVVGLSVSSSIGLSVEEFIEAV